MVNYFRVKRSPIILTLNGLRWMNLKLLINRDFSFRLPSVRSLRMTGQGVHAI
jgi:hypothetical protein